MARSSMGEVAMAPARVDREGAQGARTVSGTLRWSEEQLAEHLKRMKSAGTVKVRTNRIHDEPDEKPEKLVRPKKGPSELELAFAKQISDHRLPNPLREFVFMETRGFRLDYAWPDFMLAVEVQGMVHRIKKRFLADVEKLAYAKILGWDVLLIAGQDIRNPRGVMWLETLLQQRGWKR